MMLKHRTIRIAPFIPNVVFPVLVFAFLQGANVFSQPGVDYSDPSRWISAPSQSDRPVDVFYLYPTAWQPQSDSQIYSDIDDPTLIAGGASVFERQATAFVPLANLYAPYYRQANANLTLGLPVEEQTAILNGIPKEDVFASLDYYFENYNNGRPFILAGHSQGSNMMLFVLSEYMKEHPEVYDRMIAAYAIGYSITDEFLAENPHLGFTEGSDDIRKIISWNTEAPGTTEDNPVVLPGAIVINPLNWKRDGTYAAVEMNLGSFLTDAQGESVLVDDVADAQVDPNRGVVTTHADEDQYGMGGAMGFPDGSFHGNDFGFYYMNIRENALRRSAVALSMYQSELYTDVAYTSVRGVRAFSNLLPGMSDRVAADRHDQSRCRCCGTSCCSGRSGRSSLTLFATPLGLWTRQDSRGNFSGYDFDAYGIVLGGTKTRGDNRYGFAVGYNDQTQTMRDFDGKIEGTLFHTAVFAGCTRGSISFDVSAGYSHGRNDSRRNVVFPGYARFENQASFDQDAWTTRLVVKKTRKLGWGMRLVGGIGLDYIGTRTGAVGENCSGQSPFQGIVGFSTNTAMRLRSSSYHSLELPVSLTVDRTVVCPCRKIVSHVGASWIPELLDERASASASFVDGQVTGSFLAQSINPWDSHGRIAAGVKAEGKSTSFGIDYAFDFASRYTEQHLSITMDKRF